MTEFGAWLTLGGSWEGVLAARAGLGWLIIDQQHGRFDDERTRGALDALRGEDRTAWVRVARNDEALIGRALDAGAAGVIVPMIDTIEQALAAVVATRYPPTGRRSRGVLPLSRSFDEPGCAVMIETASALEHVELLASQSGATALFVGPFDLAAALGVELQSMLEDDAVHAPLPRIVAAARAAGIPTMAFGGSAPSARSLAAHGVDLVALATDAALIGAGARQVLEEVGESGPLGDSTTSIRSDY